MTLLDTNVLVYACDPASPHAAWAKEVIVAAVTGDGAAINAVGLAEICVGDAEPETVADRIRSWGVEILDVPSAAAEVCSEAYRRYGARRRSQSGLATAAVPLPDFFIGAHAKIMGWDIATADSDRFRTYFPSVRLKTP
jgi:predicted nucleic acid-binding protein